MECLRCPVIRNRTGAHRRITPGRRRQEEGDRMIIRKAEVREYPAVRAFYHSLIDGIADRPYGAGWKKDIYPAQDFLMDAIRSGELYIGADGETILASMVLNHQSNEGYLEFQWPTEAEAWEVTVIHALGVHPSCTGKGYARQLVRFAIDFARERAQKAIRLDVLKGNLPAEKLYAAMGFRLLHTLPMYYEDTGWTDYELYELAL